MKTSQTPISERIRISFFGRRNAGKSSLINAFTNQKVAIVSEIPGTTTDPVSKTMELLPIGPVNITDTPGYDDTGVMGTNRVKATYDILRKTDFAVLVIDTAEGILEIDMDFARKLKEKNIPFVVAVNKSDISRESSEKADDIKQRTGVPVVFVDAEKRIGIDELKNAVINNLKTDNRKTILGDLVKKGDLVVLVTPIDESAPKGRLILPQQQVLRECVDRHAVSVVLQPSELGLFIETHSPALVITDSQVFKEVAEIIPDDMRLTSFSILFAGYKGDRNILVNGLMRMKNMGPGKRILVAEGCTHHRQKHDIGREKMPPLIAKVMGCDVESIEFEWVSGMDFFNIEGSFDVIVHCGGCMLGNREMIERINVSKEKSIPITNYGMIIAEANGILGRALQE